MKSLPAWISRFVDRKKTKTKKNKKKTGYPTTLIKHALGEHAPRPLQLLSTHILVTKFDDYGPVDHLPVFVEYTPMYMLWVTFIASGITQR